MKGATLKLGEKNPHTEDKPGVSDKQEGKEGESTREKAQGVEKGKTETVKLLEEVQFAGGVKATEEEKLGVEGKRTAKGDKLKGESTDKDKSETGKRKPEGGKLKYETKPTGQKKATKGEKQGNEDELLAERDISEIEKGNLVEGNKEEDDKKEEDERPVKRIVRRKEYSLEDISFTPEIQLRYSSSEEEEVEEEVEEEGEQEGFNREAALEKYKSLQAERRSIFKKNILLLKKLAEHFKKRKMEHVYENPEPYSADKEIRYHKQLLTFEKVRTTEMKEREAITKELEEMKKQRDDLTAHLKMLFDSLIQKEREIGTKLINTKTGKVIPDRVVEELLSRQTRKLNELNEMRLAFTKLRDCVASKKAQLQSLETFGENLRLIDYKKLQMENRNYAYQIEKGDKELQRLRNKVTSEMQVLSQMKEKSYATDKKVDELRELLKYVESEVGNTRRYVTDLKKRRNFLRSETSRLHHAAGLLTQPSLLCDFAVSIEEAARLSVQLQNIKNSFYDQKQNLTKTRKSIEAHISKGTIQSENCASSGARHQQKKSHFTIFKAQKCHGRHASHSKLHSLHPVTSDCIKRSSVAGVKPAMSRQVSRRQTGDSFRLAPVIPNSKDRSSFSTH